MAPQAGTTTTNAGVTLVGWPGTNIVGRGRGEEERNLYPALKMNMVPIRCINGDAPAPCANRPTLNIEVNFALGRKRRRAPVKYVFERGVSYGITTTQPVTIVVGYAYSVTKPWD